MQIIHGLWIPEDTDAFVQRGAFYVWVETDTPLTSAPRRASRTAQPAAPPPPTRTTPVT